MVSPNPKTLVIGHFATHLQLHLDIIGPVTAAARMTSRRHEHHMNKMRFVDKTSSHWI